MDPQKKKKKKSNIAPLKKKLETINSRLKLNHFKLDSILEVTKAINNNLSKDQLLKKFEVLLKKQLEIGKLALFCADEGEWKCELFYGVKLNYLDIDVERDLLQYKDITPLSTSLDLQPFDFIIPVFHKSQPLAVVLIGDFDEEKLELSPTIKHLPFIQTLTNIIVVALENKKLAKDNLQQEVVKKELELASEMQSMLFPSSLPNNYALEVAAYYLPHHQVGGDYYDFIKLNENEYLFCIADVSGKGIAAALLMSNFQANLRALVNYSSSLSDLVYELNNKVLSIAKGERFITLFIAKYNIVTRILNYVNAAHLPPVFVSGNSANLLKIGCTGLGMVDELPKIHEGVINVNKGSYIICYTDGATEAENTSAEQFGINRLTDLVIANPKSKMHNLNKTITDHLDKFKAGEPYHDDIAILSCRML